MSIEAIDAYIHKIELKLTWNAKARQKFYNLVATFVRDGIPITNAIEEIHARLIAKKDARALVTKSLLEDMRGRSGVSLRFGQAMRKWCPSMEAIAIDAGESSGKIDNGLLMASRLTGVKQRIRNAIVSEMIEPAILIVMLIAFLVFLNVLILPGMAEVMPRDKWPLLPATLGRVADNVIPIVIGGVIMFSIMVSLYVFSKDSWIGDARTWVESKIFPWTLHRQISGSILLTCFAALLRAGIPLNAILERVKENASIWETYHLNVMSRRGRAGLAEGDSIATSLFDDESRWMIGVYGKRSNFSEALEGLSEEVIELMLGRIKFAASTINVLVKVAAAFMIVGVVFSMIFISLEARNMAGV